MKKKKTIKEKNAEKLKFFLKEIENEKKSKNGNSF
jgi:hypothetical protein